MEGSSIGQSAHSVVMSVPTVKDDFVMLRPPPSRPPDQGGGGGGGIFIPAVHIILSFASVSLSLFCLRYIQWRNKMYWSLKRKKY